MLTKIGGKSLITLYKLFWFIRGKLRLRNKTELDTIFQSEYAHEVFQGMRDRIFETKCGFLEDYESYSKRLSEGERIVILVNGFIWEVTNGGLDQFLINDAGNYAEETLQTMRTIGANEAAEALEDVSTVIFEGSPIPADRQRRCDILLKWDDQDEERSGAFYDKHELAWCEPVEAAVAHYILEHKEMFS